MLAYLALEAGRPHPREALAALLWPDHPGHKAMQNLRQSLSRLQRAVQVADLLLLEQHTVWFNARANVSVDAVRFADLTIPEAADLAARRLASMGVEETLIRAGAVAGDDVRIGDLEFEFEPYGEEE